MDAAELGPIAIAGAGIAGLSAAIALAQSGHRITLLERAPALEEAGAGLQLSPNATHILDRLGVLAPLKAAGIRPEAVALRDARTLRPLATVPLGDAAEERWGAPYLTVRRADLQAALAARAAATGGVEVLTGHEVVACTSTSSGPQIEIAGGEAVEPMRPRLLIGADGVGSRIRAGLTGTGRPTTVPYVAWRAMMPAAQAPGFIASDRVTAFLHPRFHLVAYPVRAGGEINLVAFTPGMDTASLSGAGPLEAALGRAHPALADMADRSAPWSAWPLRTSDVAALWSDPRGAVLIGDAAHAMTPFAAQGAAMAIEDAAVLAREIARQADLASALARFETVRRPRVKRVAARGAFNRFTWHAAGPVAGARNLVLALRSSDRLMADLDWLYGWNLEP